MGGDNGVKESIDGGKDGCVGPDVILIYVYPVSPYRSSHSPLFKSVHIVALLLYHPFKIGGSLRGAHDRK